MASKELSDIVCGLEHNKPKHSIIQPEGIYCCDARECIYKGNDKGKQLCYYFREMYNKSSN